MAADRYNKGYSSTREYIGPHYIITCRLHGQVQDIFSASSTERANQIEDAWMDDARVNGWTRHPFALTPNTY